MAHAVSYSKHLKSMYEDNLPIKTWIEAVYYTGGPKTKLNMSGDEDIVTLSHHPVGYQSFPSSACEPHFDIHVSLSGPTWVSNLHLSPYEDSDESGISSTSTDDDDDAQYISIPCDSPWYRRPQSSGPEPESFQAGTFPNSCSSDVRQIISHQELLLAMFHAELRRVIPCDDESEYDLDWLEEVDPEVVLSPMGVYQDLCWGSAVSDHYAALQMARPLPDVPIGFGDVHDPF
ncbi:hypothetical protein V8B97DRAFT_1917566 [Scleroderma yunnanense]